MTKRDGDKLRAMQSDLRRMVEEYGRDSKTGTAASKVILAVGYMLSGWEFDVREVDPVTGRLYAKRRDETYTLKDH